MPKIQWPHYAENRVAPLCRKPTGLITPPDDNSEGLGSTAAKTAVATAVAVVVGGILSWVAGWLPAIWAGVVSGAAWVWSVLTRVVPVPLAVLVLLVLPLMVGFARRVKRTRQEEPTSPVERVEQQLKPLNRQVLQALAQMDGLHL
jgi:hypothetical protein